MNEEEKEKWIEQEAAQYGMEAIDYYLELQDRG